MNSRTNSWTNFSQISCKNLSSKFVRIRMIFLHEKLVMLRMACTVQTDIYTDIYVNTTPT